MRPASAGGQATWSVLRELRTHFSAPHRLTELRRALDQEMRRRDIGLGDLFALVDTDGSWAIDASELEAMARQLGIELRASDAQALVASIGEDHEITVERFVFWFHNADLDDAPSDAHLLAFESALFDDRVRAVVAEFWNLADADGSGELHKDEYVTQALHLLHALHGWDADMARAAAERDWDEDRRGANFVDRRRFNLSCLQLADAWCDDRTRARAADLKPAAAAAVVTAHTLERLLDLVSVYDDDAGCRVWRWNRRQPDGPRDDVPDEPPHQDVDDCAPAVVPQAEVVEKEEEKTEELLQDDESQTDDEPPPRVETPPVEVPAEEEVETPRPATPPPSPHTIELALMSTLRVRRPSPHEPLEAGPCLDYGAACEATPREPLPRLVPEPTPQERAVELPTDLPVTEASGYAPPSPRQSTPSPPPRPEEELPALKNVVFNRDIREPGLAVVYHQLSCGPPVQADVGVRKSRRLDKRHKMPMLRSAQPGLRAASHNPRVSRSLPML